jgi:hypothetical protein
MLPGPAHQPSLGALDQAATHNEWSSYAIVASHGAVLHDQQRGPPFPLGASCHSILGARQAPNDRMRHGVYHKRIRMQDGSWPSSP